jgi:hypothetical protein
LICICTQQSATSRNRIEFQIFRFRQVLESANARATCIRSGWCSKPNGVGQTETQLHGLDHTDLVLRRLGRNPSRMKLPVRGSQWQGLTACRARFDGKRPILRSAGDARLYSSLSHDAESHDIRCGSSGFITVE